MSEHTVLVDGTNIAWQVLLAAKYSNKKFNDYTPENASEIIYGFLNVLSPALNPLKNKSLGQNTGKTPNIVVALDKGASWRYDMYPEYKEGNKPSHSPHSRFGAQINRLPEQLAEFGIKTVSVDKLEGDDVVALLADNKISELDTAHITLISKDKDLLAYVSDKVSVYNQATKKTVTKDNFSEYCKSAFKIKQDIKPEQLPTFRAFAGDTSDNIIGVVGCAAATSAAIVKELEDNGVTFKGSGQDSNDLVKQIKQARSKITDKRLLPLLSDDNLKDWKDSYDVVNVYNAPKELQEKLSSIDLNPLPKPAINDVEESLKKLGFQHFIKQFNKGWALPFSDPKSIIKNPLLEKQLHKEQKKQSHDDNQINLF